MGLDLDDPSLAGGPAVDLPPPVARPASGKTSGRGGGRRRKPKRRVRDAGPFELSRGNRIAMAVLIGVPTIGATLLAISAGGLPGPVVDIVLARSITLFILHVLVPYAVGWTVHKVLRSNTGANAVVSVLLTLTFVVALGTSRSARQAVGADLRPGVWAVTQKYVSGKSIARTAQPAALCTRVSTARSV